LEKIQDFIYIEEKEMENIRERKLEKNGIFNYIREKELEKKQHF
jgi:hypothetical protein